MTVELDDELAGVAPIYEGQLQPIGQIGAIVRIPQGPVTLIGTVTLVGISELTTPLEPAHAPQVGDRWLKVQLLGEISALGKFERGVSGYPGLDDPVHMASSSDLKTLYPAGDDKHLSIGALSAAPEVPFSLDLGRLVTRHSAVVGSTGAGKTSAVATIVQQAVRQGWQSANIIIIDAHGEYAAALKEDAQVIAVSDPTTAFRVPYWALPAGDVLRALSGAATAPAVYLEMVVAEKQKFAASAPWITLESAAINVDTPIPYDIRKVWYDFDVQNRATVNGTKDESSDDAKLAYIDRGDYKTLKPASFAPYQSAGKQPNQGKHFWTFQTIPDRLRLALKDPRLTFFHDVIAFDSNNDPLPAWVSLWVGSAKPVSVLDFSGVPTAIVDLAVGAILTLLFEIATRCTESGIGCPNPVLIVIEEAHRYLAEAGTAKLAQAASNKIAREGRKYGVGLMLVSQRPSELPETALSQVGTLMSLRLTNSTDQSKVKSALPDAIAGLADALPALRNGEAIISGEAAVLPSRVRVTRPEPRPDADDPDLLAWREETKNIDVGDAIGRWRRGE